jgi:hypothetical protein
MDISGITSEQILQIPELAHLHKAVLFLEQNKGKRLFPKKYEASMIDLGAEKTYKLLKEQPTMPLKEALVAILSSFKSDLSGELLLKITQEIIKTHEKLSKNVFFEERVLETV